MRILTVNVGSSSLKLSVLDNEETVVTENISTSSGQLDPEAVERTLRANGPVDAVGHRVVHGGQDFTEPVLIDERVRRRLDALVNLAPLHLPRSLAGIDLVRGILPTTPSVACFDTAFHATMPAGSSTYALPAEWRHRWALRRYGFHGLSHSWAAKRAADLAGRPIVSLRTVTCHLGAGASLAAVAFGRSVDTTMGFTPLEGLVMATRSGSVDPGLVLWLEEHVGLLPAELAFALEHRSGLLGLTGSSDMQMIIKAEAAGDVDAALGVSVFLHHLRAGICAMAAAMGGLDTLVFTGGIGEHAATVRQRAAQGLDFIGLAVDEAQNSIAVPDAEISARDAKVRSFVVTSREDIEIGRNVRSTLSRESE